MCGEFAALYEFAAGFSYTDIFAAGRGQAAASAAVTGGYSADSTSGGGSFSRKNHRISTKEMSRWIL